MQTVTLDEAKTQLGDLVEAVVSGETVVIETDGHQIQLVPVTQSPRRPQFGSARGQIHLSDDFDAPLPDFDDSMR